MRKRLERESQTEAWPVEPGLLALFRIYVGLTILLLLLRLGIEAFFRADFPLVESPWPGIGFLTLLLGYLSWQTLQRWMGRFYLPAALILFVGVTIASAAANMRLRVDAGLRAEELVRGSWILIVVLLVPLILVAWQYGLRWVVWFCLLSAGVELCLTLPLAGRGGPPAVSLIVIAAVRALFFLPVGYAVARLVAAQRHQRVALAEANARLRRHAVTLEELAVSRERNRLGHELHDTLAHGLSAVAVQLEAAEALWTSQPQTARGMLNEALATTRTALTEARRAIVALRASPLEDKGLLPALQELAQTTAARGGLELRLEVPEALNGLDSETEHLVYRIVTEAMTNVLRHARAQRLALTITDSPTSLQLRLSDDGCGFDAARAGSDGRFGLRGMHERARIMGGELEVDTHPGSGTTVGLSVQKVHDPRPDL